MVARTDEQQQERVCARCGRQHRAGYGSCDGATLGARRGPAPREVAMTASEVARVIFYLQPKPRVARYVEDRCCHPGHSPAVLPDIMLSTAAAKGIARAGSIGASRIATLNTLSLSARLARSSAATFTRLPPSSLSLAHFAQSYRCFSTESEDVVRCYWACTVVHALTYY